MLFKTKIKINKQLYFASACEQVESDTRVQAQLERCEITAWKEFIIV